MKKALSLIIAILMVAMMAVSVSAATIKVDEDAALAGHKFVAYQVFSGTQAEGETAGVLGDIQWGNGINSAAFLTALKADATIGGLFTNAATAADVATVIGSWSDKSENANIFAQLAYDNKTGTGTAISESTTTIDTGYYLIVDTTTTDADGNGVDEYVVNSALLQVTGKGDVIIGYKTDMPTLEKKVAENVKYTNDDTSTYGYMYGKTYNDVADYDIGDEISFRLYTTVPDMTYFETYKMVFHDTYDAGLTVDLDSFKVTIGADDIASTAYSVAAEGANGFTVTINNLKTIAGIAENEAIVVTYTAVLNKNAVVGLNGNVNTAWLEYSNNPNESTDDADTPDDDRSTGNTVKDSVIVFTYALDATKVDGTTPTKVLEGAEFVIYKGTADALQYAVINAETGAITWTGNKDDATVLTSDENGKFGVTGLDDGTYYLLETKAPAGYNLVTTPTEFKIEATTSNGQSWTTNAAADALTAFNGNAAVDVRTSATVTLNIHNNKGAGLPETGGIGTTIFYIVGGLLMFGAVVVLVARKRSSVED